MDNVWAIKAGCFSQCQDDNLEAGHAYGVAADHIHATWRSLLDREKGRLDAVAVLTPTPTHHNIVVECLRQGLPVICEKSLAATSQEARDIKGNVIAHSGFLAVTYNYSGYPMVRELRRLIASGVLGRPIHFQAEMPQEGFIRVDAQGNPPTPQSWRLRDGAIPTIHLDLASHLHHLIHYLTSERPLKVVADQHTHGWFPTIVDDVSCLCRYSNGLHGQMWFSKSALGHRNGLRVRLYGSKGSAEWFQASPEELLISHIDGRREVMDRAGIVSIANEQRYGRFKAGHPAGFIEAFSNLYLDIGYSLRRFQAGEPSDSDEVFGVDLALEGLVMLEAMAKSVSTGLWTEVSP